MVFLSSRISPLTSTVIFFERSPCRDGRRHLGDVAHLAGQVRGHEVDVVGQSPSTCRRRLGTSAWPPSLPSVPTSRATRVTSDANDRQLIDHRVDRVLELEHLALDVDGDLLAERSPLATAVVTSAMLRTWPVRFAAMPLTLSVRSFHVPATPGTSAWPPSLPSVPTSRATRVTSDGERRELIDHDVDRVLQLEDLAAHVDRDLLREVAVRDRGRDLGDVAHLAGQVRGHEVDVVGEILPHAGDAAHLGLAAELALGADLARDARDLAGERSRADRPSC